jgi:transposase InsO family protein
MQRTRQGRYNGVYMSLTHVLPGAASLASLPILSKEARKRLQWMDYYKKCQNASLTCRYFGISRKTFHQWKKRYDPYRLESLEAKSRRPKRTRQWQVSREQEFRVLELRREHLRYGKEKLRVLYQQIYQEPISSWKVQRVIEKRQLYWHPAKTAKLRLKRRRNQPKKRITELKRKQRQGFLVQADTVVVFWNGLKRYILTGIDHYSKIAFARMYVSKHSKHAADFLERLHYLFDGKVENIQTDNGSEFALHFREAAARLNIPQYFSRVKTPTDNAFDERFNRTLKEEFVAMGNMTSDCEQLNKNLTEWLVEYNFRRPHQALGYETPINFHYKHHKVLPMYPSSTQS